MNLNVRSFPSSQNIRHDLKGPKVKYILHYRWVRGAFLQPPHGTQHPAAEIRNNNKKIIRNNNKKLRSFKSKENIHKKEAGPYHGFGY